MAILGKIRERSIFLIIIIGMALMAFVFTGLFGGNSTTSQDPVLVVGDEEVSLDEFSRQVDFAERNYRMTTMQAVNFAFNQSTNAKAYEQAFEVLGLNVGKNHIEQFLKSNPNFSSNPQFQGEDGTFDTQKFKDFILDLSQNNPQGFEQWKSQEASIKNNIRVQHYQDMVNAGLFVTNFEAEQEYALQNDLIDLSYVRIPYSVIPDSIVKITDKDIANYIKENKKKYERDAARSIRYVQFVEEATSDDKVLIENELQALLSERKLYNEVSKQEETFPSFSSISENGLASFVSEHSDLPYQDTFKTKSELSENYANTLFNLADGKVFGPYEDNGYTKISRIVARENGGKAKARHILIAYQGASNASESITRTKEEAKKEANALLTQVKRGGDFAQLARDKSDGPSANRGGDLPDFVRGEMVAAFNDFVFDNKVGTLGVVETNFGFHVIEIQDKKDVVKLATIAKKLVPSEATSNTVFTQATQFELDVQDSDFIQTAKLKNYVVRDVNDLNVLDETLPSLGAQRQIVRWAFDEERKASDVSRFSLSSGGYLIVQISAIKNAGLPEVEEVKANLMPLVIKEKKKALVSDQIKAYASLEEVATQFKQTVSSAKAINRFTSMLSGAAQEPLVIGASFHMDINSLSEPILGNSGVFIVQPTAKTSADKLENYAGYKASKLNNVKQNANAKLADAVKAAYDVIDNRKIYY